MRYHILTTAKFINECIKFQVYGSTNSNWLANVEFGDMVFISQFNYKSQDIYGPFRVKESLFYDKKIIYLNQKYYYRIKIKPTNLRMIEETDLYLQGIKNKKFDFPLRFISLLQQNKHLHSISITDNEGQFLLDALNCYGKTVKINTNPKNYLFESKPIRVDLKFIENKNRLFKKHDFSSECDLESYVLLSLKNKNSSISKNFSKILNYYPDNNLAASIIYNQFIFGNAYPSDIVILNNSNINIFELKKNQISESSFGMIEKEFKKYCYYSLYSLRLLNKKAKRKVNFFIIFPKNENHNLYKMLKNRFQFVASSIKKFGGNNFIILEYDFINDKLTFDALQNIKN